MDDNELKEFKDAIKEIILLTERNDISDNKKVDKIYNVAVSVDKKYWLINNSQNRSI